MVSIVISSIRPALLNGVLASIDATVGIEHEVLVWDNRGSGKGLAGVYNDMSEKAGGEIVLFLHEDVTFQEPGWGLALTDIFRDPSIGLVGVAGSRYKSRAVSGWYTGLPGLNAYRIDHLTEGRTIHLRHPAIWPEHEVQTVTVDGVFMACRKSLLKKVRFDEELCPGFHFYDIDFSLRASKVSRVVVTDRIGILHHTLGGDFGDRWMDAALSFHHRYRMELPASVSESDRIPDPEAATSRYWIDYLKREDLDFARKWRFLKADGLYLNPSNWYGILKLLVYRPFRLDIIHAFIKKLRGGAAR
jgi:GT2 family glycosyltransferase